MITDSHLQSVWHLLTEYVPSVVWAVDRDFRFVSSLGTGLSKLGLEPDQVVGVHLFDYLGSDDPETPAVKSHLDAMAGTPGAYEVEFGGRYYRTFTHPVVSGSGEIDGVVGIAIDVTTSHQAELEVEQLFDLSLDMMCVLGTDGYFRRLNPKFQEVLGYTPAEMMAVPFTDFLHPDDVAATEREADTLSEGGQVLDFVNRYRTKDGDYRWFEWRAVPSPEADVMFGVARDITERREMERRLEFLSVALDRSPDAAYLLTEDGRIRYTNDAAVAMLGYSHEEFTELSIPDINVDPAIREDWPQIWQRVKDGKRALLQTTHRTKDGRAIPVEVTANLLAFGSEEYSCAFVRDISERTRAEATLHKRQGRMRVLFDIAAKPSVDLDAQLHTALERTVEILDLDCGIISHIEGDRYHVEHCFDRSAILKRGSTHSLGDTYCSITFASHEIVTLDDVGNSPQRDHPCYGATGLEAYVGAVVYVGGQRYGTLNVTARTPRAEPFDEVDREFLALLAIWVGSTLERSQAESRLRASEEALAMAVRGGMLGLWDWDVATGVTRYSKRWAEMLGYRVEELDPDVRTWERLVHPEDLPGARTALEAHFDGTTPLYQTEHRLRTSDGGWKWILTQGKVLERNEDGEPLRIAGTHLDIDARKRSERERVANFERARRFQEAIVRMNTHPAVVEGNFDVATRAITEIVSGVLDVERIGIWLMDAAGTELAPVDLYRRATNTHSQGSAVPMIKYPRYFEAIQEDTAIDASDAVNDPRTREFGGIYYEPMGITSILDACIRVRGQMVGVVSHEHSGPPRQWRADEIAFAIQVGEQITQAILNRERREDEEAQRRLELQIQQAQKLESLGILAGGIAHDFNNLLTAILGNADLAKTEVLPGTAVHANLDDIEVASRRAADLCRQMLAYSGKGSFVIDAVDMPTLVREMAHMLDVSISKKVQLNMQFADDVPAVEADVTQIRQVVMNLITNASEAIGDAPGVIVLRLGALEADRSYLEQTVLTKVPAGRYAFLEVTDTGCGMDESVRARLFDPFFTTKFTGRGLGMAAVLGIVRGHQGAITVESTPGKGSTFRVLLPAASGPTATTTDTGDGREPGWQGSGLVLLIDDEEVVRSLGKKMLERLGFEVLTAVDGEEGVEVFRRRHHDIQCVVLDLTMPRMDGSACLAALQEVREDVCVILSSGYSEQEVASRFAGSGLAGFIQKPYQLATLRRTLHAAIGEADDPPTNGAA